MAGREVSCELGRDLLVARIDEHPSATGLLAPSGGICDLFQVGPALAADRRAGGEDLDWSAEHVLDHHAIFDSSPSRCGATPAWAVLVAPQPRIDLGPRPTIR